MGRLRTKNKHLPHRMVQKHGAYYYVQTTGKLKKWTHLSRDLSVALQKWAEIEGERYNAATARVSDLIAAYLAAQHGKLSPETIRGYEHSQKRLTKKFGTMRPADLKREHVYRYLIESGKVVANRDRALLGAAYTHAQNMGLVVVNPAHGLRYRNPEKPRDRYVTDTELDALLKVASPKMAKLIRFAYLTGMRQKDLIELKLTAATEDGIAYTSSKTKRRMLVGWSDELRGLWREIADDRIGAQPVFKTRAGGHYTSDGIRTEWAKVKAAAKVADVRFHDLRRKAGSDVDESETHKLLGNEPSTARKHYRAKVAAVKPVR
jgi:integrase